MPQPPTRRAPPSSSTGSLTLTVLRPGSIDIDPREGVRESWPSSTLIENEGFRVLVDLAHPGEDPGPLLSALGGRGLDPADIDAVLFTHLHPDHIGHRDFFGSALFVFHESERLAFYFAHHRTLRLTGSVLLDLDPRTFAHPRSAPDWPRLDGLNGCVYARHCPGHTPGSLVVFASVGGSVHALAGDIVLSRDAYEGGRTPGSSWRPELIPDQMRLVGSRAHVIVPGHGSPFRCRPREASHGSRSPGMEVEA